MKRFLLLIAAVVLCFCSAFAQSAFGADDDSSKYTLTVETKGKNGEGIIIARDGTFVTTFDLIKYADYIKVKTQNGKTYTVNGYRYLSPMDNTAILTLKTYDKFVPIDYSTSNELYVNYASIPVSTVIAHAASKKILNVKNSDWIEFTSQKLTKNELEEFMDFAEKNDDIPLMYRYLKPYARICEIPSHRYALLGAIAISGYLDKPKENKNLLENAYRWFALSINSKKNIDVSAYGLYFASILNQDTSEIGYIQKYMKRKTLRKIRAQLRQIDQCQGDYSCVRVGYIGMCKYLQMITGKGY